MKSALFPVLIACFAVAGCNRTPQEQEARYLRKGHEFMVRKDYARALLQFNNAVRLSPQDAEAEYELGLAYLADGNVNAGVAAVLRATRLDPQHVAARVKLAELMARSGDPGLAKESQKQMQELLAASPGNIDALNTLARAELQLGESEDAERHLQEALGKLPNNISSTAGLALIYLMRHDTKHAEGALKQAVAAAPQSADAAVSLAEFYVLTGRWAEAEAGFHKALSLSPGDAPTLLALGAVELRLGQKDQAQDTYRKLSALPGERYRHAYAAYLFDDGQREAGIKEFEKLAANAPGDRAARGRLVAAYLLDGRVPQAERVLGAALKDNPNDVDARLQRSQILLRSRRDQEAEADLVQVTHFKPDSAEAHYLLAQIYGSRGDRPRQTAELSAALRYNPGLQPARVTLAQLMTLSNSPDAALEVLNAAPERQKQTLAMLLQRNMANYVSGDKQAFREGVARALQLARSTDVLLQDAVVKLMDRNYAGARASIDEALAQTPDDLRALRAKAFSYTAQNQPSEAERFLTAYGAQSKSAAVQEYVGEWLWSAGKHDQARAAFARAKAIDPRFLAAYLALAEVDVAEGNLDQARASLTQVQALDSRNFPGQLLFARLESKAGRYPAAVDHYRIALELQPRDFVVMNNLAYLLADKAGQLDEALPLAQHAVELAPESADNQGTLGWILYRKGFYQEAGRCLQYAVSRDGDGKQMNAVIRKYHLAMTYMKLGDRTQGRALLLAALQQNPSLPEAAMAQSILRENNLR
jgi:tetratricopeptide (TPR) repeat protein